MFKKLRRISYGLLGALLFAAKSVALSLATILSVLIFFPSASLIYTILLINNLREDASLPKKIGLTLLLGLSAVVLIPLLTAVIETAIIFYTFKNFFKALSFGAKTGFNRGLGKVLKLFIHEEESLNPQFTFLTGLMGFFTKKILEIFKPTPTPIINPTPVVNDSEEFDLGFFYNDSEEFDPSLLNLEDVPKSSNQIPELEVEPSLIENFSAEIDTTAVDEFLKTQTQSPQQRYQMAELKTIYGRYLDLRANLEQLATNNFEDELMPLVSIEQPILLLKQYKVGDQWYAVPASTRITDKNNLEQWLSRNLTHPLTREDIASPLPYEGKTTRFCWHHYQGQSQELQEAASKILSIVSHPVENKNSFNALSKELGFFGGHEEFYQEAAIFNTKSCLAEVN